MIYPIGIIIEFGTNINPNVIMPGQIWEEFGAGRVTVAKDDLTFNVLGLTGGEEKHKLTVSEMPFHNHSINAASHIGASDAGGSGNDTYRDVNKNNFLTSTDFTGEDLAHNNLQPYVVVKRYIRIG